MAEPSEKRKLADTIGDTMLQQEKLEQRRAQIAVLCVEDLERTISRLEAALDRSTQASKEGAASAGVLATRVFWLNIVLAFLTGVGVLFTGLQFFFQN